VRSGAEHTEGTAPCPTSARAAASGGDDAAVQDGIPSAEEPLFGTSVDDSVHTLLAACERRVAEGTCRYTLADETRDAQACAGCACGPQEIRERPVQLCGSALARALLRLAGWRLRFDGLPARQGVIVVYPHTSNWDFVWGVLAKWAIGLPLAFWGKDTLFRIPIFGRWLRWIGGLPVDRQAAQGVVAQTAARLIAARARGEFLWLGLAPEGTRSRTAGWRSGFYHVATQAQVPVALAYIDYAQREVGLDSAWRVHGDLDADLQCFAHRLGSRAGRVPANAAPIRRR